MGELKKILAKNLRAAAGDRNAFQIHKLTGVNRDRIEAILAGKGNIRLDTLEQLARGLGIAPESLIASSSTPKPTSHPSNVDELTDLALERAKQTMLKAIEFLENQRPRSPKSKPRK